MNLNTKTGWFYMFRGNGYGPFPTKVDAETNADERRYKDKNKLMGEVLSRPKPFHATVTITEDKKLYDIKYL